MLFGHCSILLFFWNCEQVEFGGACFRAKISSLGSDRSFIFKFSISSFLFSIWLALCSLSIFKLYVVKVEGIIWIYTSILFFLLLLLILHFFELNYFTNSIFLSLFFFKPPLLLFLLLQSFFFNLTLELKSLLVLFPCSFSQLFIRVKDRYSFLLNFLKGIVFLHCTGTLSIDYSNWSLVVLRGFRSKQVFHGGFINVGQSYWLKLFFTCCIS